MTTLAFTPVFHSVLQDKIEQEIDRLLQSLGQGSASDFADYRDRCGVLKGLYLALELAEATRKQVLEN